MYNSLIMEKVIQYFQSDVKRINHALKVFSFAQLLAEKEDLNGKIKEVIIYSSLLHDIGIKEAERKYNSSSGKYQELEGPSIAEQFLKSIEISPDIINRVCYLVGNHHSYDKIDGIDFQILVEADLLVNIFEEGLPKPAIINLGQSVFKTVSGKALLDSMYLS
jgi:uncharacterized protein